MELNCDMCGVAASVHTEFNHWCRWHVGMLPPLLTTCWGCRQRPGTVRTSTFDALCPDCARTPRPDDESQASPG